MKNDLSVLGIVLVPGVVHGLSGTSHSQRRDELQFESLGVEEISQSPMVVAGGLKPNTNRKPQTVKKISESAEVVGSVLDTNSLSAAPAGSFDQRFVVVLGHIDSYPHDGFGRTLHNGHGRFISFSECSAHSRYRRLQS